jgi:hypothetical protein
VANLLREFEVPEVSKGKRKSSNYSKKVPKLLSNVIPLENEI